MSKSKHWPLTVKIKDKRYEARAYYGRKSDVYGNNRACDCSDLLQVNTFCVCIARVWCSKHGGPRCVGGHD